MELLEGEGLRRRMLEGYSRNPKGWSFTVSPSLSLRGGAHRPDHAREGEPVTESEGGRRQALLGDAQAP